jgi:hypothetical protein
VRARWGTAAHIVFLFFCFLTNIIVTGEAAGPSLCLDLQLISCTVVHSVQTMVAGSVNL